MHSNRSCWNIYVCRITEILELIFLLLLYFDAGFNVETVEYKNISFTVWDVGGQDKVLE